MDKKEFEDTYRKHIRVAFDWEKFASEPWELSEIQLALPRDTHRIWTPWNMPRGKVATHSLGGVLSLREVIEDPSLIGDEQDSLFKHEAELVDGVRIDAPAFALSAGRLLLLDHNHRVAATAILKRTAVMDLALISGPDLSLLPDLAALAEH